MTSRPPWLPRSRCSPARQTGLSPVAYRLQGYLYNRPIFNAAVSRLSQVIVGEITLDQAYARIDSDVQSALAAAK